MSITYCGKSCESCTYQEELNCSGCQSGPGRVFSSECKLAQCCREKGHETCDTCVHQRNCGMWLDRSSAPRLRIERQKEQAARQAEIDRCAPILGKWLKLLFFSEIVRLVSGMVLTGWVIEWMPSLEMVRQVLINVCSIMEALILLKISTENKKYAYAGGLQLLRMVVSCMEMLIPDTSVGISYALAIVAVVMTMWGYYYEFKAHAENVLILDGDLSEKWDKVWKMHLYSMIGLCVSILFALAGTGIGFFALLVMLVMLVSLAVLVVASVLSIKYRYNTAHVFLKYSK